jgi:hypothetical protein
MKTLALIGALAAAVPPAAAQEAGAPPNGPDVQTMTCADFTGLGTDEQMVALSTIQPFGDEMNAGDRTGSEQWAATVNRACLDHPDRMLTDAAREAMGY